MRWTRDSIRTCTFRCLQRFALSDLFRKAVIFRYSFGRHSCDRNSQVLRKRPRIARTCLSRTSCASHAPPLVRQAQQSAVRGARLLKAVVIFYPVWELNLLSQLFDSSVPAQYVAGGSCAHFSLTCTHWGQPNFQPTFPTPTTSEGLNCRTNSRNVGGTSLSSGREPGCRFGFSSR